MGKLSNLDPRTMVLGAALLGALVPMLVVPSRLDIGVTALIYVTLALGLNVTVGYAGLLDLGYVAFYAVGAYTYGVLNHFYKVPFVVALPLGAVAAAAAGLMLGAPTLRLRGDYLAIVTLGFAQMIQILLKNLESVTNGVNGILGIERPSLFGFFQIKPRGIFLRANDPAALIDVASQVPLYYLALAVACLTAFSTLRLERSRLGRALMAIREDEVAARAMGINTSRMKVTAFALGASFAGLAGVLFAGKVTFISPESFTFLESVLILSMVVLGGMGSVPGVILGALTLYLLPELLRDYVDNRYRMLIFGVLMIVMMLFRPQGLLPSAAIRREVAALKEEA